MSLVADPATARRIKRRRILWHLMASIPFVLSFYVEGTGAIGPAYLLRASVVTLELFWTTQLIRPPTSPELYVKLLWLSLWLIPLGLWGAGVWPKYRVGMLHIVFLGGLSLMTFAVATMVIFSHSGAGARLREPSWVLRFVGTGLVGAMLMRVGADLWPTHFFPLLGLSAVVWLLAAFSWLIVMAPLLIQAVAPGEFERRHEEAKRRLAAPR